MEFKPFPNPLHLVYLTALNNPYHKDSQGNFKRSGTFCGVEYSVSMFHVLGSIAMYLTIDTDCFVLHAQHNQNLAVYKTKNDFEINENILPTAQANPHSPEQIRALFDELFVPAVRYASFVWAGSEGRQGQEMMRYAHYHRLATVLVRLLAGTSINGVDALYLGESWKASYVDDTIRVVTLESERHIINAFQSLTGRVNFVLKNKAEEVEEFVSSFIMGPIDPILPDNKDLVAKALDITMELMARLNK